MGVFLSDLTFIEDGNADLTGDGLINYDKRRRCAEIIQVGARGGVGPAAPGRAQGTPTWR